MSERVGGREGFAMRDGMRDGELQVFRIPVHDTLHYHIMVMEHARAMGGE